MALARRRCKYAFASSGPARRCISAQLVQGHGRVDIVHVPYKGAGAVYCDLIAGVVQIMFRHISSCLPQVRGCKVRGLAVTSSEPRRRPPTLPALAETLPGYVATSWLRARRSRGSPGQSSPSSEAAITAALATPEIPEALTDIWVSTCRRRCARASTNSWQRTSSSGPPA